MSQHKLSLTSVSRGKKAKVPSCQLNVCDDKNKFTDSTAQHKKRNRAKKVH